MTVLGLDPGTARTGYGIVEEFMPRGFGVTNHQKLIGYGCIETSKSLPVEQRLKQIYEEVMAILETYPVDVMAVEKVFFSKNVKTAGDVNQARGVMLLCSANSNIKVQEYTPLQVKQSLVGYGNATKKQIQFMVKAVLSLEVEPQPDDAADALALAICHFSHANFLNALNTQGKL